MLKYTYRYYNPESEAQFGAWLASMSWSGLLAADSSNSKADIYQREVTDALENFFPLITVRRKASDPAWYNRTIKKKMAQKMSIYKREGRSPKWRRIKKIIEDLIEKRRERYAGSQKDALLASDGERNFFKNVKSYKCCEREKPFDVTDLFPGKSDQEVSELLADHFNAISNEFEPIDMNNIPSTYSTPLHRISAEEISSRLRTFKKPRSMVPGDIFPQLVAHYSIFLAEPLEKIYNGVITTYHWPLVWRNEYVSIIPKSSAPEDLGGCRNISCMNLFSKVLESFLLEWSWEEISPNMRKNQFGGQRGCGTEHFLSHLWTGVLEDLEDSRGCSSLISLDFAKAFNRLDHMHILRSYARLGASTEII